MKPQTITCKNSYSPILWLPQFHKTPYQLFSNPARILWLATRPSWYSSPEQNSYVSGKFCLLSFARSLFRSWVTEQMWCHSVLSVGSSDSIWCSFLISQNHLKIQFCQEFQGTSSKCAQLREIWTRTFLWRKVQWKNWFRFWVQKYQSLSDNNLVWVILWFQEPEIDILDGADWISICPEISKSTLAYKLAPFCFCAQNIAFSSGIQQACKFCLFIEIWKFIISESILILLLF